jgi:o-succinylbenzoate---CoA ligase
MLSVSQAARDAGHQTAVLVGGQSIDFEGLWRRVLPLADKLGRLVPSSQPVAFVAHPTLDSLLLLYALLELGHGALPLNPRLLPSDHRSMIEQAGAFEVSIDSSGVAAVPGSNAAGFDLRPAAVLIATSGTTGRAKLVKLSQRALLAAAEASADRLGWFKSDRWLLSLSLCHVGGLSIATRCLIARQPVVLGVPRGDPDELMRLIQSYDVTLVSLVPTQLHRVMDADKTLSGSKLRVVLLGGMQADPWIVAAARLRGVPVLTTYGMTEMASQIATQLPDDLRTLVGPCHDVGPALSQVEVKILNDEILVRGPMLFDGYAGEPVEVDSMRGLSITGIATHDGWFRTGDWGRLDANGRLTVVGRAADRIVTAGENVAPAEVERVLEALPAIERACVFGVPEAVKGEQVAAAVILRAGFHLDLEAFESQIAEHLAPFKRPRAWAALSEFAVTPTGKLDRAATARSASSQLQIMKHRP